MADQVNFDRAVVLEVHTSPYHPLSLFLNRSYIDLLLKEPLSTHIHPDIVPANPMTVMALYHRVETMWLVPPLLQ
jgi:hypothetical protein